MSHAVAPSLGDRVRGALVTARIRQVDAAAELGISQPVLSRRLAGELPWRDGELEKLAALCGVDPKEWTE
jgi:predicted transcriptional regulator